MVLNVTRRSFPKMRKICEVFELCHNIILKVQKSCIFNKKPLWPLNLFFFETLNES